ncbi:MAG TPA: site-2 protease family protein [Pirellulaceae bacterium]|nr:site-2 protease family protein [Pirellulaceae bacterium]
MSNTQLSTGRRQSVGTVTALAADEPLPKRRKLVPFILFLLTCLSTFWVGITAWQPLPALQIAANQGDSIYLRQLFIAHWEEGLIYMACVLAILLCHELGHFVMTLVYRVPATVPIFLPFPFNPIGTLGAVIGMKGIAANRKQIFDIGLAGPLAGLVVAVPIAWWGVMQLDLSPPPQGGLGLRMPLGLDWLIRWMGVPGYAGQPIWLNQLNPYFAAAWVGFFVTGLNMIPVGQLDGGHITYTLWGRRAQWLAQALLVAALASMLYFRSFVLVVMVALVLLMGTGHPPTKDEVSPMGWSRCILGYVSLIIPVLCFPPMVFEFVD